MRQVNLDLPSKTEEDSRTSVAYSQEAGSPHKEIGQLLLHYENATNKNIPLAERDTSCLRRLPQHHRKG